MYCAINMYIANFHNSSEMDVEIAFVKEDVEVYSHLAGAIDGLQSDLNLSCP